MQEQLDLFFPGQLLNIAPVDDTKQPTTFFVLSHKSIPAFEAYALGKPQVVESSKTKTTKWKLCGPNGSVDLPDGKRGWVFLLTRKIAIPPLHKFGDHLLVVINESSVDKETFTPVVGAQDIEHGVRVAITRKLDVPQQQLGQQQPATWAIVDGNLESTERRGDVLIKTTKKPNVQRYLRKKGMVE